MKRILLHICCAPDGAYSIQQLQPSFSVACFFFNPNIDCPEEYQKRESEARRVAGYFGAEYVPADYPVEEWRASIKGFEGEPEGGRRCEVCYWGRLQQTAKAALDRECEAFTTSLTVSPHKNAAKIFCAGARAETETGVPFVPADFKKNDGFKKSVSLGRELGLYRQNYCGCSFSLRAGGPAFVCR